MNKFKWLIFAIYGLFVSAIKIARLSTLSKLPVRKELYLSTWHAGLANCLVQLVHAQYIAERGGFTGRYVPPHGLLKVEDRFRTHNIKLKPQKQKSYFPQTPSSIFRDLQNRPESTLGLATLFRTLFFDYDIQPFSPRLGDYRSILKRDLSSIIPHHDDTSITDETLVIHIRSGDVFVDDPKTIVNSYVQPPTSYYSEIIDKFNFRDVVIVSEKDLKNPCINQLMKLIPNIRIQTSDLISDMSTIISARNLIVGVSTFSLCLGLASDKLKRLFIPQFDSTNKFYYLRGPFSNNIYRYFYDPHFSSSHLRDLDIEAYLIKISSYTLMGDWRNSEQQRKLMVEHSRDHIRFL